MPNTPILDATVLLEGGARLELRLQAHGQYRMRYGRPGAWRVVYEDGRRVIGGRAARYAFRSVEQMRYDFERDVEDAQAAGR